MARDDPDAPLVELLARTGAISPDATRIVTHGAVIILDGDRAWKLKRPVAYRYLDFSTAERRRDTLREGYGSTAGPHRSSTAACTPSPATTAVGFLSMVPASRSTGCWR